MDSVYETMFSKLKFLAFRTGFMHDFIGINIYEVREQRLAYATNIQMEEIDCSRTPPSYPPTPVLTLNPTQAQELMDSLWDCGIRPTEGTGSAGALAAVKYHLEDMRRLVFKGK